MPISKQPSPADVTYNDSFLAVTGWPHMISRFPFLQLLNRNYDTGIMGIRIHFGIFNDILALFLIFSGILCIMFSDNVIGFSHPEWRSYGNWRNTGGQDDQDQHLVPLLTGRIF